MMKKKHIILLAFFNLLVVSVSLFYNFLFLRGYVGKCQFYNTFGLYCPGCGGSRSLNALLNFKLLKSFIFYPPIIVTSLLILFEEIKLLYSFFSKKEYRLNLKFILIIPVSILISFVIRYVLLSFGIDPLGNIL